MRRLGQFGVDDDDVGVGIVDHDLDRLHIDGRIDHRGKACIERIADDAAGAEHFCKLVGGIPAQRIEIQAGRGEGVDQQTALAARQRHRGEARGLGRFGMDETLGGFDHFVEAAHADHAFARRDGVEGLDRARERAGMRHGGGASAFGRTELERDHRLAGGARGLAGFAEDLGVPHAFEIDHDHADGRIGREIGHQVRSLQASLVAGCHHIADADAAVLQRLADRHHDRAGLTGDRYRTWFHRDHAVVDVGEHLLAGAEIAKAIRAGNGKAGLLDGLLQFGGELLAFLVLQFAEAGGDDGRRARACRRCVAEHLYCEACRHQHQHVIRFVRQADKILVAGNAPDGFPPGIERIKPAFELIFNQVVPDAFGVVARFVRRADQHDIAWMQHGVNIFDDVAGIR